MKYKTATNAACTPVYHSNFNSHYIHIAYIPSLRSYDYLIISIDLHVISI